MNSKNITIINVKNLRLRTIIGANESERTNKQDIIVNLTVEADSKKAIETDNIEYACNYRNITKKIIETVENSNFFLLEKLVNHILKTVMEFKPVLKATVEIDKPGALRFADSVSVKMTKER